MPKLLLPTPDGSLESYVTSAPRDFSNDNIAALQAMARQDMQSYHDILALTVPLSHHIFKAPTRFYKTGVVFMAYLNGHQKQFTMVGGQQSTRSLQHLAELFRLADKAGLLQDPELASSRMTSLLIQQGVGV